jgi:hypothetical protein
MDKLTALSKGLESDEYERMTGNEAVALFAADLSRGLTNKEAELRRADAGT